MVVVMEMAMVMVTVMVVMRSAHLAHMAHRDWGKSAIIGPSGWWTHNVLNIIIIIIIIVSINVSIIVSITFQSNLIYILPSSCFPHSKCLFLEKFELSSQFGVLSMLFSVHRRWECKSDWEWLWFAASWHPDTNFLFLAQIGQSIGPFPMPVHNHCL